MSNRLRRYACFLASVLVAACGESPSIPDAGSGAEPDAGFCVDETIRYSPCGSDGAGVQRERCVDDDWRREGACRQLDECTESAERTAQCGHNLRGERLQRCVDGQWSDDGACVDPDVCEDDTLRYLACGANESGVLLQRCTGGSWVDERECIELDECSTGTDRVSPCGLNGRGEQTQSCVSGRWVDEGVCEDPDECLDATTMASACGLDGSGLLSLRCDDGRWSEDGSCVGAATTVVASDDTVTVLRDSYVPAAFSVERFVANDADVAAATFVPDPVSACGGTIEVADGILEYTQPAGLPADCLSSRPFRDRFDYVACSPHDPSVCDTATITIEFNHRPHLARGHVCVPVGWVRASLDVAAFVRDEDGDSIASVTAGAEPGSPALVTVSHHRVTVSPDNPLLVYGRTYDFWVNVCDDSGATPPACSRWTWHAIWNDPPSLNERVGENRLMVPATTRASIGYDELISTLGTARGVPGTTEYAELLRSVGVSTAQEGPFSPEEAPTALGTCWVDSLREQVGFDAGASPGRATCWVQVCEVCSEFDVCAVTPIEVEVTSP